MTETPLPQRIRAVYEDRRMQFRACMDRVEELDSQIAALQRQRDGVLDNARRLAFKMHEAANAGFQELTGDVVP